MSEQIEGRRPVLEALRAGRQVERILLAEGVKRSPIIQDIVRAARDASIRIDSLPRAAIERKASTESHQGVIAVASTFRYRDWGSAVADARAAGRPPLLLALDGITDPRNAGALIRSALAFGVDAVVLPERRSASVTAAVVKASAGATEHVPIDRVPNLRRALDECKAMDIWVISLVSGTDQDISSSPLLTEPCAVVVGAEGSGVSRLVAERSDAVCAIPMSGAVGSLNASVAGAIALWEVQRARQYGPRR